MNIDRRFPSPGRRVARLLPLLLAAALATACSSNASDGADAMPAPEVSVARVLEREVRQWDDFTGRVAAVETVELRPRVSGYVQRVAFEEGQLVRKGDLLFEIDPRPYRAALARAEAELARARSEARLAAAQHERAQALVEARAISREEFETRNAANAQGHAAVRAAEAAVAAARLDLQFTQVRAPIDGRAGRALVTVGNLAQADATVLTTVVSQDPVHVYFEADEQTWLRYSRDAGSGRDGDGRVVRVGLAGEDGLPHAGTLDFIDNQVDPATGTIRARAVLRNPDGLFTPGLFARVQLAGAQQTRTLLVDDKAVLTDQDRKYVWVLGEDDTAQRRDVELGRVIEDGLRVVRAGLSPEDRVIVSGVQRVFMPGMPVAPTEVAMAPAGDADVVAQAGPGGR
ncbi:MAG: efflux RND transporter periplasmic adaptor subunit [Xanthomonadaceae bacterium]|nr:efflux RND transporter periplasmic adaptor subunit [Xanthomonadaceae bacterium]